MYLGPVFKDQDNGLKDPKADDRNRSRKDLGFLKSITLMEMLQAGVHFGHKKSLWNPKMREYIFTTRNNIHIFDLEKTRKKLAEALEFVSLVASLGGTIIFIGTKRQAKAAVRAAAESAGCPYVVERWLGGTFTNFRTIQKSIKKMEKFQKMIETGEISKYTKKEQLMIKREVEKMKLFFTGIKDMKKLPEAIVVFDVKYDNIPVREAKASKVKVVGIVDTNADPSGIDYLIPSNDDAIKVIEFMSSLFAQAVNEGKAKAASAMTVTQQAAVAE